MKTDAPDDRDKKENYSLDTAFLSLGHTIF